MAVPNQVQSVSVLLPVRNGGRYLHACLSSLEHQTWRDFEVVAVDDGSDDGSAELLRTWSRRDTRFRVLHQEPRGLIAALNVGLEHCRGELIARLDADDVMARRRLELQVSAFRNDPVVDVVSCQVTHFPRAEIGEGFRLYEAWLNRLIEHEDILRERFIESPLAHPSVMMRRAVVVDAGGYRDVGWPEDYDLWLRLLAAGRRFRKVPRRLYFWRDHATRQTRVDPRYATPRFLECKACYLMQGPLTGAGRRIIWGAGQTGRRLSKYLLRRGATIDAFIDISPRKIGRTRRGTPIHPPEALPSLLRESPGRAVLLVAVAARGARDLIRPQLDQQGLREGVDYWCVA